MSKTFNKSQILRSSDILGSQLFASKTDHIQRVSDLKSLKPENIIIDCKGYTKLTDFGLSRYIKESESAYSICGTAEYLAPEVLLKKGYGKAADWWTFGCLLFELYSRKPPFIHKNKEQLFENITSGKYEFNSKMQYSLEFKDLLTKLLIKNPDFRLGSQGSYQIKEHPWFQSINFDELKNRKIPPPFIPCLQHEEDVSNFDPDFTAMKINSEKSQSIYSFSPEYSQFEDFSFNRGTEKSRSLSIKETENSQHDIIIQYS